MTNAYSYSHLNSYYFSQANPNQGFHTSSLHIRGELFLANTVSVSLTFILTETMLCIVQLTVAVVQAAKVFWLLSIRVRSQGKC